jgi:hypothetical protein
LCDYRSLVDAGQYDRAECSLVEFDGCRTISNVQQRADGSLMFHANRILAHEEMFSLSGLSGPRLKLDLPNV